MTTKPTRLGAVVDVNGPTITVYLDESTLPGLAFVDGHSYRIGQVGSFVRIPLGYIDLFGVIAQAGAGSVADTNSHPHGSRWLTIEIIGESIAGGAFRRGVSTYPTIGDQAHLVIEPDLARIYGTEDTPSLVRIGGLAAAESIPAFANVDRLVTRHCAVVGNTGSGKSTTVAALLAALSDPDRYPSARILILDLHGEYSAALRDRANIYRVNPDSARSERALALPYWALTFDELVPLTFGHLDDVGYGAVREKIATLKKATATKYPCPGLGVDEITVDTPIPFSIHHLWFELHRSVNATHTVASNGQTQATEALEKDASGKPIQPGDPLGVIEPRYQPATLAAQATKIYQSAYPVNIRRQVDVLASRLRDPRQAFLFRPGAWASDLDGATKADLGALLSGWLGNEQPISIFDLSGIPSTILNQIIGVLLRIVYDALFWGRRFTEGGVERPLLIVLEEAHNYLDGADANRAGAAVRRIVKEGRKYGMGAMIVSQRPHEIDQTILSQCGTIVAMRLTNDRDRGYVSAMTADNLRAFMSMLPILRTGEAIIVGEGVHLPVRVLVDQPPPGRRPNSEDPLIHSAETAGGWTKPKKREDYVQAMLAWRRQDPSVPFNGKTIGGSVVRQPVASSNVAEIGYDEDTSIVEVLFTNQRVYHYYDVPIGVWSDFVAAPSKGEFVHEVFIRGGYRCARVS